MRDPIYTIGHSTHPIDTFVGLLRAHGVEQIADVRLIPKSARYPHFALERLAPALEAAGIRYRHFRELGGRRRPRPDSVNTAWRVEAFRGYADYMATEAFADGLDRLLGIACGLRTAILCAEAVWWRCHRGLIADALCSLGLEVVHILGPGSTSLHPYTAAARIIGGRLSYATRAAP